MSANNSDSEGSVTGWTVVNDRGEAESSDDGSATGSSTEFIHLDNTGATYQRRKHTDSHHQDEKDTQEPPTQEEGAIGVTSKKECSIPETLGPLDDWPESNTVTPEQPSPSPSPNDEDNPEDAYMDGDEIPQAALPPEGATTGEYCVADSQEHAPDGAESDSSTEILHKKEVLEVEDESAGELNHDEGDRMVLLGAEAPERAGDEVFAAERAEDAVLGAAALPRHVSESDSDSDFVQLDAGPAEVDAGLLLPEVMQDLETSTSSHASSSSISANFRFVHPAPAQGYPIYREEEEEEEDLPEDFDDRCESDISGIATDDSDVDLSNMTYGIGDIPLTAGARLYCHHPNRSLNSVLTVISLMALFLAVGVGIGHYMGSARGTWLRHLQVTKMKSLQDDYLMCLKEQDLLEQHIDELSVKAAKQADSIVMSTDQFNIVANMWRDKYDELNNEKAGLEAKIEAIVMVREQQQHKLDVLEADKTELAMKVSDLLVERMNMRDELGQEKYDHEKLRENKMALEAEFENLNVRHEKLKATMGVMSEENHQLVEKQNTMNQDLVDIKLKLNQIQTENDDLRSEVMRLRYTAHPGNFEVNPAIDQQKLKVKVNMLANENEDLKSAVGKMRYTKPLEDQQPTLETSDEEPENESAATVPVTTGESDLVTLQQQLTEVTRQLEAQQHRNYLWQSMFVGDHMSRSAEDEAERRGQPITSFFKCIRHLVPEAVANMSTSHIKNATEAIQRQWTFLKNVTSDNVVMETLQKKWKLLMEYTASPKIQEVKDQALQVRKDIQDILINKWLSVTHFTSEAVSSDTSSDKVQPKTTAAKYKQVIKNLTLPVASHFQEYMNKTKETVSKLSVKLHDTWEKVKNLSTDFLKKHEDTIKTVKDNVKTKIEDVGKKVRNKWKKLVVMPEKDAAKPGKNKRKKHQKKGKYSQKNQQHSKYAHTSRRNHGENTLPHDPPRPFEDKPHHKQRQSNHEQYDEFWRRTDFDPEGLLQEGFFEGNQREWRKHQKRLHRLHGRIHRLNEDILYAMDDDDIEDIYDDLEDFQDDLEDEDQPQLLQTWLACQVRWWKSRFQRKHRREDLINGCGKQIMHWQLKALCQDRCKKRKCLKKWKSIRSHPLCHDILHNTDIKSQAGSRCQNNGQHSQCQEDTSEGFHYQPGGSPHPTDSNNKVQSPNPQNSHQPSSIKDEDALFKMESERDAVTEQVNDTLYDSDVDPAWYFERAEDRGSQSDPDVHITTKESRVADDVGKHNDKDSSWFFKYASMREDLHHNPDWIFERAAERDFERTKSWYIRRMEERAQNRKHLKGHVITPDSTPWGRD